MINVKLRRKGSRRNKIVVSALAAIYGFATIIFVWFGVQNVQFRTQVAAYRKSVSEVAVAAPEALKQFKSSQDTTAHVAALETLTATMSQKVKDAPKQPNIFGFTLGSDGEHARLSRIQASADAFVAKLKEESAFISYQTTIAHSLQSLSIKDAGNYDQIAALANEWQQSIELVKQTTAPAKLTDVSATLMQKMASVQAIILQLGDLYKANNESGFAAKQKELAPAVEAFKPLSTQISQSATTLDNDLAATFAALKQNL